MTVLYRFFDEDRQLLYVGIARNPLFRWGDHSTAYWWKRARLVTLEHFRSRREAKAAETQAIRRERPLLNSAERAADVVIAPDPARHYTLQAIAEDLRASVDRYPPGSTLPSSRELSRAYGVSMSTIGSAKRVLATEGLIFGMRGSSTVVLGPRGEGLPGVRVREREDHPE